ncbi:hypothetical protein [Pseudomonas koreensis]|uniref:hypothetical protein n=1 Tax=Pseudomonas koreensis TaxID=198620 RepID=UPI003D361B72
MFAVDNENRGSWFIHCLQLQHQQPNQIGVSLHHLSSVGSKLLVLVTIAPHPTRSSCYVSSSLGED